MLTDFTSTVHCESEEYDNGRNADGWVLSSGRASQTLTVPSRPADTSCLPSGAEGNGFDARSVAFERQHFLAGYRVPEFDAAIVATGGEAAAIGVKGDAVHNRAVAGERQKNRAVAGVPYCAVPSWLAVAIREPSRLKAQE